MKKIFFNSNKKIVKFWANYEKNFFLFFLKLKNRKIFTFFWKKSNYFNEFKIL